MQVAKVFHLILFSTTHNEVRSVPYKAINNNNIKLPNKGKNNGLQNIAFPCIFPTKNIPVYNKIYRITKTNIRTPYSYNRKHCKNKDNGII